MSNLARKYTVLFSQLALCIPRSSADIVTHSILEQYLGATQRPRYIGPGYNGVAVYTFELYVWIELGSCCL